MKIVMTLDDRGWEVEIRRSGGISLSWHKSGEAAITKVASGMGLSPALIEILQTIANLATAEGA